MKNLHISIIAVTALLSFSAHGFDPERQRSYDDGEFEGNMGWYASPDESPAYYAGFSEGRAEQRHEEMIDELRQRRWDDERED